MARILGGAMPQPYGAYDPGSGSPRMDLWFRKILADMQGIKEQKAAQAEAGRKAGMEERKLRVGERGVELKEEEFEREGQPMVLPPEMVSKASTHFKMTPESFQGLEKSVQVAMIGEMIREAGREKGREFQEGQEAVRTQRQEEEARYKETEATRLRQVTRDSAVVRTARARLEKERTRLIGLISPKNTTMPSDKRKMYTTQLENIDAGMRFLGEADMSLSGDTPLGPDRKKGVKALLGDISKVRDGSALENLIGTMSEMQEPVDILEAGLGIEPEKEVGVPENGAIRTVESGKYKGMTVIYDAEKGRWFPHEGNKKTPFVSPKLRGR